jgi:hypothetical protein
MRQKQLKHIAIVSTSILQTVSLYLTLISSVFSSSLSFSELTRKAHSDSLDNTASMVYLCLLKVQLALSTLPSPTGVGTILSTRDALNLTITTAEKYCDRLNPCDVLDILPPSAPLALLQTFLSKSIESANSRKRNLQVRPLPLSPPPHLFRFSINC